MKNVTVTRHPALVEYLHERGIIDGTEKVLFHATPEDLRDAHVVGVLPLELASLAASVTEIPIRLEPEDRGKELSILAAIGAITISLAQGRVIASRQSRATLIGSFMTEKDTAPSGWRNSLVRWTRIESVTFCWTSWRDN